MIIDFHTHIFPQKIAQKALTHLSKGGGGFPYYYDGTPEALKQSMAEHGIDKSVVLNIATNPAQQRAVNDFAAAVNSPRLIAFGSVHPYAKDAIAEIDRICDLGLKGIKFHLDCQDCFADDRELKPIYEHIGKKGLMVCFHMGWDMSTAQKRMTPKALRDSLPYLAGAKVIAAHLGGYALWDEALEYLCGQDVYLDTSFSCGRIPLNLAAKMIDAHDENKVLFGTDGPWTRVEEEKEFVSLLPLKEETIQKIFYKNAQRLLGGDGQ